MTSSLKRPARSCGKLRSQEFLTRLLGALSLCWLVLFPTSSRGQEAIVEAPISDNDRDYWAFRPIVRPALPTVTNRDWPRTAIDLFILAGLEQKELTPAPAANRLPLLRRLSFDLTGLPPSAADLQAFENDPTPDAYERQVDRLLASPAYGEHWAQYWLDLARFAETDGFEHDLVRPEAWKYRDWVIAALNRDLPYDQFIVLQLAGDELPDGGDATATMFCLSGPDMPDVNDQAERRHALLNAMTATVGSVFLGLQLGCAECHDHKYDPLSQADFYRLRAVFESAVPELKRDGPWHRLQNQSDVAPARLWIRGDHRRPGPVLSPGFPRVASRSAESAIVPAGTTPRLAFAQWLIQDDNPLTARVLVNRLWQHHFGRGLFATPSDVGLLNAGPTHPELLDWLADEFRARNWSLKSLHRLIVTSATYRQTSRALPEDTHWSQRLEVDPDNELYSRGIRRRLQGEAIRDAMLSVSGLLNDERGGPGVMPPLPAELVGTLLKGQWTASPREADHYRRSIYLFARRNLRYPLFEAFDRPDANASCAVRSRSTTAPQSLVLFNSALSLQAARHLAGQAMQQSEEAPSQIDHLFLRTCGRHPTASELQVLEQFLTDQTAARRREGRPPETLALPIGAQPSADSCAAATLVDLCLALLNASEFLYID